MTPERLKFILDHCARSGQGVAANYEGLARFLDVTPRTLRRWLNGETPIPRVVELLFEVHHAWPEVNSESMQRLIDKRDRAPLATRRRP